MGITIKTKNYILKEENESYKNSEQNEIIKIKDYENKKVLNQLILNEKEKKNILKESNSASILPLINTINKKPILNHIITNIKQENLIIPNIPYNKIPNINQSQELLKIRELEKDKIENNNEEQYNQLLDIKRIEKRVKTEENERIIKRELSLDKKRIEEEKIFNEELRTGKGKEELEKQKIKKFRKKHELSFNFKEKKLQKQLKQFESPEKRRKLEIKKSLEMQKQMIEDKKKIKRQEEDKKMKEEEEKISKIIEELKLIAEKEKELELKELKIENNVSKHRFRLDLLNELVNHYLEIYKSNNIKKILEIINKIGKLFKKEINYDKEYCKDNILYISDAVKSDNIVYKFLGVLGEEFYKYNIYSFIEGESEDINLMDGVFKVLLSQYSILPKYEIKINSMPLKIKILKNPKEWLTFIYNFKRKISEEYSIPKNKIYIISQRIDKYEFTIVILDRPKINLKIYRKRFDINISQKALLEYVKLSPNIFEVEFNRNVDSWEKKNFKRGGEKYIPPYGWKGFALKVLNKFDNGDNTWLGKKGKKGEWAIAYHGIGKGDEFKKLLNIILNNLKNGPGQLYKDFSNIRDNNNSLVGEGVYLAPDINEAKKYSDKIQLGERKCKYQLVIMCRVKPDKIREPGRYPINWIVDDNYDCLRPYRILIKESWISN